MQKIQIYSRSFKATLWALILLIPITIIGCSSSSSSDDSIPLFSPQSISVTSKNKHFVLQWTNVPAINDTVKPIYNIYLSEATNLDFANAVHVGYIEQASGWLGRVYVGDNPQTDEYGANIIKTASTFPLTNGTQYRIWVEAEFQGYGKAAPVMNVGTSLDPPVTAAAGTAGYNVTGGDTVMSIALAASTGAASYDVVYMEAGSIVAPEDSTNMKSVLERNAIFTELDNTKAYDIYVRAVNSAGYGSFVKIGNAVTLADAGDNPTVPTDFAPHFW